MTTERIHTTFKGPFGDEMQLIQGMGDHVFLVDPFSKDEKGNPRTMMMTIQAMREFLKEVDGDDN